MKDKPYHMPAIAYRLGFNIVNGLPIQHIDHDVNGNPRIAVCVSDIVLWSGKNQGAARKALKDTGWRKKRGDDWIFIKQTYNEEGTIATLREAVIKCSRRVVKWELYSFLNVGRGGFTTEINPDGTLGAIFWRGYIIDSQTRIEKIRAFLEDAIKA